VPTSDDERLIAWYVAPKADKLLVVYFHGNGDTLSWRTNRDRLLMADGTGLLAISYRGFPALGGPTGGHRRADPTGRCPRLVTATLVFAGSGVDNTCVSVLSPLPSEGKLDDEYRLRLD